MRMCLHSFAQFTANPADTHTNQVPAEFFQFRPNRGTQNPAGYRLSRMHCHLGRDRTEFCLHAQIPHNPPLTSVAVHPVTKQTLAYSGTLRLERLGRPVELPEHIRNDAVGSAVPPESEVVMGVERETRRSNQIGVLLPVSNCRIVGLPQHLPQLTQEFRRAVVHITQVWREIRKTPREMAD